VKRIETREVENAEGTETQSNMTYYLTSSVLGGVTVAEMGQYGDLTKGWIYAGGEKLAEFGPYGYVAWRHVNPVTGNWVTPYSYEGIVSGTRTELDPLGADVGATDPYISVTSYSDMMGLQSLYEERGNPFDPGGGCGTLDGLPISCSELRMRMQGGSVATEYLVPEMQRSRAPTRNGTSAPYIPVLNTYRMPIVAEGLGLFMTEVPVIRGGPVGPGNNNEGYYLDWSKGVITVPQNTATDIDKTWSREFDCNRSANDLFRTLRRDFSKFASFAGPLAGGLGTAGIHFEKGPVTEGRTIGITTGIISNVAVPGTSVLPSETRQISVTVQNATTTSFTFRTNPGHVLYPGTISFAANDAGPGRVAASVTAKGNFADTTSEIFFNNLGGKGFENSVWKNFLDNLQRSCGSLK